MRSGTVFTVFLLCGALTLAGGFAPPAYALLASHQCSFCHDLHGGASYAGLLKYSSSETTCLSCHSVAINDTKAAAVHNPLNKNSDELGYITCRECHTPHSNIGSNIKLVGYKYDPQHNRSFSPPTIRVELPTSDPGNPVYKTVNFTGTMDFNIADEAINGACEICHSPFHNAGQDCTGCHSHGSGFPKPACTDCHNGSGSGALAVGPNSPHSTNTIFASKGVTFTCGDCHGGHSGTATITVPNNTTVGIDYSTSGHNGIALRDGVGTGTTEAEVCWNCHARADIGVSEWGVNTDTNGTAGNYNFGDIYTTSGTTTKAQNWVGAWWKSGTAKFSYKTGQIQSTHSVNNAAAAPGLDSVASIRCSYCHDVHDTYAGSPNGKPYLRGTWMGNPYREDGAPQAGDVWTTNNNFGAVPRGGIGAIEQGGYQIDQNNVNPTVGWTLPGSAGLCTLCHGTDVNNMNKFGAAGDAWVGTNGHSNAVIGGTGLNKANIFQESLRKPTGGYCNPGSGTDIDGIPFGADGYCAGYPNMAYQQLSTNQKQGWGFRGYPSNNEGFLVEPSMTVSQPYAYRNYNWGATANNATTDASYHKFSCSKCHNPHASRLPRLMITNCLDISHNTWDDAPKTMTKEDTLINNVTWTRTGGTYPQASTVFNIEYFDINSSLLYVPNSTFGTSYSNNAFAYTISWNGQVFNMASRGAIVNNVSVTLYGTSYVFDSIKIDPTWVASWTGRWIPSRFTPNDDGSLGSSRVGVDNGGKQLAAASSAQNCHRYVVGKEAGWNKVTPW